MTDRDALVQAIADHPREDTPRLALADWFQEHGRPERAEYVRAACAAARARRGTEHRAELLDRADDLLAEHEAAWLGEWAGRLIDWNFSRGFLRRVRLTARTFLEHGEELLRAEPAGRVELEGDDGGPVPKSAVAAVVEHPAFARVRDCAVVSARFSFLQQDPINPWLEALAGATHVTRLRRFGPAEHPPHDAVLDGSALVAFCEAGHLRVLRNLDLSGCRLGGREKKRLTAHIADAPFASSLRTLRIARSRLSADALTRIAVDPVFARLRALDVSGNAHEVKPWKSLFESGTLTHIRTLAIGAESLSEYARSPMALRVRNLTVHASGNDELDSGRNVGPWRELIDRAPPPRSLRLLSHNPGREAFAAMRRTRWLRRVRSLAVGGDSQYEVYAGRTAGIRAQLFGDAMPRLTRLRLHEACDDRVLAALSAWRGLERLESLELTDDYHGRLRPDRLDPEYPPERLRALRGVVCDTDEDAERLLSLPRLERLAHLDLSFSGRFVAATQTYHQRVSVAAAERVVRSGRFANLTSLRLGFNQIPAIEARLARVLAEPGVMPRLRRVRVHGDENYRTEFGAALRARFGRRFDG